MKKILCIILFLSFFPTPLFGEDIPEEIQVLLKIKCPSKHTLILTEYEKGTLPVLEANYFVYPGNFISYCSKAEDITGPVKVVGTGYGSDICLHRTGYLKKGVLEGEWIDYYPSGAVSEIQNFHHGDPRCSYSYYEDEQNEKITYLRRESCWKNGKHELVREWHSNGTLDYYCPYKDGEFHGTSLGFYENGQREYFEEFDMGNNSGLLIRWNEDGSIKEALNYIDPYTYKILTPEETRALKLGGPEPAGWEKEAKKKTKEALKECKIGIKKIKDIRERIWNGEEVDVEERDNASEPLLEAIWTLNTIYLEMRNYEASEQELLDYAAKFREACILRD